MSAHRNQASLCNCLALLCWLGGCLLPTFADPPGDHPDQPAPSAAARQGYFAGALLLGGLGCGFAWKGSRSLRPPPAAPDSQGPPEGPASEEEVP